ncbi:MAG: DUF2318 domain-containing protein [Spirochaetaceae bacterium]|jgi:uncharacterized membrane protein|nr:DUF2318 domain-containing protein [Spirochaetaceae bacterium]
MTENKKDRVLNNNKSKNEKTPLFLGIAGVLAVALVVVIFVLPARQAQTVSSGQGLSTQGDNVVIPLGEFDDGIAKYYRHEVNGTNVDFFVLRSSDGIVRAAFDACDVCYGSKRGYRQEGDNMVCNNCGQRFASVRINEEKGGCNPSPLERTIQGDHLVISQSDIAAGIRYF